MLARSFRLAKKDLSRLYQKGRKIRQGDIMIRYIVNHLDHPRFAVIISKKVAPKAVDRNRLKRLTHTYLAKIVDKCNNTDIAITYYKTKSADEIAPELDRILSNFKER